MYKVINWDTGDVISEHDDIKEARKACRDQGAISTDGWENKFHRVLSPVAFVQDANGCCVYNPRFKNPEYNGD